MYHTMLCLLYHAYFTGWPFSSAIFLAYFGLILASCLVICQSNLMITSPSLFVCWKAPCTSVVPTYFFPLALITQEGINTWFKTVEEDACSFCIHNYYLSPLSQPQPLILPFCFSLRNIKYYSTQFLYSLVTSLASMGKSTSWSWNCCVSFLIISTPFPPNTFKPLRIPYWKRMTWLIKCVIAFIGN